MGDGDIDSRTVTRCGLCGSERLECVLQLGATPPTCAMLPIGDNREQERYPLELLRCADCSLVQLGCIVDPAIVFHPNYPYSSGTNRGLAKHFLNLATLLQARRHDLVVDVGANDGTLLSNFSDCVTVGVEPTRQLLNSDSDIDWQYQARFTSQVAQEIVDCLGHAQIVTACNVLAHVDDPHDFMEGVRLLLASDGLFVTENHALESIVDGRQWDTVYHEHLRYYDETTLTRLLQAHGLNAELHQPIPIHGGSFRTFARKTSKIPVTRPSRDYDWKRLREDVARVRWYLRSLVSAIGALGERIGAIGATARATTIIGYCGLNENDIDAVYEVADSNKIGHYIPGTRIPVVDEAALAEPDAPEHIILFLWYMADSIVPRLRDLGYEGEIIVPLPKVKQMAYA